MTSNGEGKKLTVLILTSPEDEHGWHVFDALSNHPDCDRCFFLDTIEFPASTRLSLRGDGTGVLHLEDLDLPWSEIDSVYWRQYGGAGTEISDQLPDAEQAHIAANDSRSLVESMLMLKMNCKWVNGIDAYLLHQTKPLAFLRVRKLLEASGWLNAIQLPRTLWSNDPEEIRQFASEFESSDACIFKPVQGGAHTGTLRPEMLSDENLENLKYAPITLQEKVEGRDIRVFIAGEKLVACEIITDALDFRDDQDAEIKPVDLPEEVQAACHKIAKTLHLTWTGIDLRKTADGRYFYFEANPSPMFMGFEAASGLPLTEMLVDSLLSPSS